MFEELKVERDYNNVTEWSFDFLISIARRIHDFKDIYSEFPVSVSISRKSYEKLCASEGLDYWIKNGKLKEMFYGVEIIVMEWDGEYMSMRGKRK